MNTGIPFGDYQLIKRIARGGMAEVFLAVQSGPERFRRFVAVKRILPHLADSPQFVDMFMDEARLAARLSHPNIAHIYEFGEVSGSYFIAMEYIDGIDLSPIILAGQSRLLPLGHAARIAADVCAGLHYAHQLEDERGMPAGLVHRDISPQNILVSFDGTVKIVDFGIAKVTAHIERTRPGVIRGKYSYMSPEQITGDSLDGRGDLFCVGIVLYELCTGEPLYPRANSMEAMQLAKAGVVPKPTRNGQALHDGLTAILYRALARSPQDRYENAAAMQLDLERYLHASHETSNSLLLGGYLKEHYRALVRKPDPLAPPLREESTAVMPKGQGGEGLEAAATAPLDAAEAPSHISGDIPSSEAPLSSLDTAIRAADAAISSMEVTLGKSPSRRRAKSQDPDQATLIEDEQQERDEKSAGLLRVLSTETEFAPIDVDMDEEFTISTKKRKTKSYWLLLLALVVLAASLGLSIYILTSR
jgi:eukaryotic-like serine/threonine-protein kinase